MTEVFEHNLGDHEDPLPGPTWIVGLLGAVLLTVIMLGLTALYYNAEHQEDVVKVLQRPPKELENLRQVQEARLTGEFRLEERIEDNQRVDQVVIPIDQAMRLVIEEAGGGGLQ